MWPPTATYHLAHALYEPAALPTPPELRGYPDRRPSLGTGLAVGRAMRASCYSDRGPDHDRRRVTPRSSFPVSLAALVSTSASSPTPVPASAPASALLARARGGEGGERGGGGERGVSQRNQAPAVKPPPPHSLRRLPRLCRRLLPLFVGRFGYCLSLLLFLLPRIGSRRMRE